MLSRQYLPYLKRILYRNISLVIGPGSIRAERIASTLEVKRDSLGTLVENLNLVEAHMGAMSYGSPGTIIAQTILRNCKPRSLRLEAYTLPIWVMTALQSDRLVNLEIDFRCDKTLWRPPEDSHLLNTSLDNAQGTPWFLQKRLQLRRISIVRPPLLEFSTLVEVSLRMLDLTLEHLEIRGGLEAVWYPSPAEFQNLGKLTGLAIAVCELARQLPPNVFPELVELTILDLHESQMQELPAFIRNPEWLPSLRTLYIRYNETVFFRNFTNEMREIRFACRDRGILWYTG